MANLDFIQSVLNGSEISIKAEIGAFSEYQRIQEAEEHFRRLSMLYELNIRETDINGFYIALLRRGLQPKEFLEELANAYHRNWKKWVVKLLYTVSPQFALTRKAIYSLEFSVARCVIPKVLQETLCEE